MHQVFSQNAEYKTYSSKYTSYLNSVLDKNAYEHKLIDKIPNFSIQNNAPTILGEFSLPNSNSGC